MATKQKEAEDEEEAEIEARDGREMTVGKLYRKYKDIIEKYELSLFIEEGDHKYNLKDSGGVHTYHASIDELENELKRLKTKMDA